MSWTAPDSGGSPISGYTIYFVQNDGVTYSTELTHCDMASSTATTCTVPVSVLRAAPFSLNWGASVFAKVVAINSYGNSLESSAGNGAVITTNPDQPTNLQEVYAQRTKSTLGLSWSAPVFTGGDSISDYRLSVAEQGQAF